MVSEHYTHFYCFLGVFLALFFTFTAFKWSRDIQNRWKLAIETRSPASKELKNFTIWQTVFIFIVLNTAIDIILALLVHFTNFF